MADRKEDRKLRFYTCGWCGSKIRFTKQEKPPIPCPACGWYHKERKYNDVPTEIKISLNNPSGT